MCLISPYFAIRLINTHIKQIKQCEEIVADDSRALQDLRDYFVYTQEMENNAGVNLFALASEEGGTLFNNTYAQSVLKNGEEAAQAGLRQSVTSISANGEIVRSFAEPVRKTTRAAA